MYSRAIRLQMLDLIEQGKTLRSISMSTGIARATLRDWRGRPKNALRTECPRCEFPPALDRLGVAWRFCKPTTISVARRDAVARLDRFVGPKY